MLEVQERTNAEVDGECMERKGGRNGGEFTFLRATEFLPMRNDKVSDHVIAEILLAGLSGMVKHC